MLQQAKTASDEQDHHWVLELIDHLLAIDEHVAAAVKSRIESLRALVELEINAAARNYYLLSAQEQKNTLA